MKTFKKGGTHPPEMKELSKDASIQRIDTPPKVFIPVSQHIGVPAKTVVNVGDVVDKGQVIAEANGFVSVPVHASVSGKVVGIEKRNTELGKPCDHIIIESDGEERWAEGCNVTREWQDMGTERIKNTVRDAGIVGMGGAVFPTHVKLSPPDDRPIDTVIINGVECEPFLTCDYRTMLERTRGIVEGLRIIMKVLGVHKAFIGVEENKKDAYETMRDATWQYDDIHAELLKVKYPQGAEKQLIDSIVGRQVPAGKLPLDIGVVVQNVGTVYAIYEAVTHGLPLIERVVTVTGDAVKKPANLLVPIGTPISDLLARQGIDPKTKKIILGGPMMGIAVPNADFPVVKGTSGVLALKKIPNFIPGPCIRCGKCVDVCPLRGMVAEMVSAIDAGEVEKYEHLHVLDCVECGACAFVCPAHRSIVQHVRKGKAEFMAWKAEQKKRGG